MVYPLHEAIAVGDIESLKKHLEAGADVDRKNQADNTPLFTAAGLACFGANIGELRQSFPREKVLNAMAATTDFKRCRHQFEKINGE